MKGRNSYKHLNPLPWRKCLTCDISGNTWTVKTNNEKKDYYSEKVTFFY